MTTGRLHVHLHELKEPFKDRCGHGDISDRIRWLVRAYLEESFMILKQEVLDVIDKGDFETAVDLLLPGLQKLREDRMQAGSKTTTKRKAKKAKEGRRKGGVKSKEDREAEAKFKSMMEGFK